MAESAWTIMYAKRTWSTAEEREFLAHERDTNKAKKHEFLLIAELLLIVSQNN